MSSGSGSGALALAAVPRGVQESGPLACDYPARGGVPQCLAAATKPIELAPGQLVGADGRAVLAQKVAHCVAQAHDAKLFL